MTGLTRRDAAFILARHFNSLALHAGGSYDTYTVQDDRGRIWKLMSDGSIDTTTSNGECAGDAHSVELVSPICQYADIETIQTLVSKLKEKGAVTNASCGIHVHIGAERHTPLTLRNIANIIAAKEDLLYKALQIEVQRERYCQKTNARFLAAVNSRKPATMDKLKEIWYDGRDGSGRHYDNTRYHCLNLHSVFSKGTVEFRLFNSTLDAKAVKAYIQLCLAVSKQALTQKSASYSKTQSTNEKYTFRTWLLRLGMIGDEFKDARQVLLEHLDGNIAWRDPAQAEAQKQRLAEKKLQEQQANEQGEGQDESPAPFTMSM